VSRHSLVKFEFPSGLKEDDVAVFIHAPSPNGCPPSMYSSPCIAAKALNVPIADWQKERLDIKDWHAWLLAMRSLAVRNGDTVKLDLAKKKFNQLPPCETPLKKPFPN
jgi:hypothetical protein